MKARMKSGKIIQGRLADTFVRLNLAKPIKPRRTKAEIEEQENENVKPVKKQKTKAK